MSGLNFAFLLLAGRALDATTFGALAIFTATVMFGLLVHSALVVTPMTLEASDLKRVLRDSLGLHVVVTIGLSVAVLLASVLVQSQSLAVPIRMSAGALPFVLTGELLRRGEMARGRWIVVTWSDSIGLGLRVVVLVVIGALSGLGLGVAVITYSLGPLVSSVALLLMDRHAFRDALAAMDVRGRLSRRQGGLLLAGQLASWGNSQALMYTVGASVGLAQVGALSASQVLLQPLNIMLLGAGNWSLPYMTRLRGHSGVGESSTEIVKHSQSLGLALSGLALLYGLVLLPLAPYLLRLLYGAKYVGAVGLVALWVVAYVLSAAARGLSTGITALRRADVIAIASLSGLPLIALLAVAGTSLGAAVVPIGSSIGSVVQLLIMMTFFAAEKRRSLA